MPRYTPEAAEQIARLREEARQHRFKAMALRRLINSCTADPLRRLRLVSAHAERVRLAQAADRDRRTIQADQAELARIRRSFQLR